MKLVGTSIFKLIESLMVSGGIPYCKLPIDVLIMHPPRVS